MPPDRAMRILGELAERAVDGEVVEALAALPPLRRRGQIAGPDPCSDEPPGDPAPRPGA